MDELERRIAHTLLKEQEGIEALRGSLGDIVRAAGLIKERRGKIIVTGVGKSGFIGMKTAATLMSLGHAAHFLHPVEALHGDTGLVCDGDVLLAFSFSGNSSEVNRIVAYLKKTFDVRVVAVTGRSDSELARQSDVCICVPIQEEGCPLNLAPMASTTASLVVGDLLASALTSPDSFNKKQFARLHPGGSLGLQLVRVSEAMLTGKDMPLVREETPMTEVLKEITKKKRGITGVANNSRELVGIITDGDVRRFLMKYGTIKGRTARDAMTKNPKTICAEETIEKALSAMKDYKVANLFVVDGTGALAGVIHMRSILNEYVA